MNEPPPLTGQTTDEGKGKIFPCGECGADLEFHIGQQSLKCPFCGAVREIDLADDAQIQEQDFHAALERLRDQKQKQEQEGQGTEEPDQNEVRCESCGSDVIFTGTLTSTDCPYCGSPIQREHVHSGGFRIPVDGVLPFKVERKKARQLLGDWVKSRWFAPNEFLKRGVDGAFNGVYLPFWTFDSLTFNRYSGQRGENYTVTVGSGKNRRTETRTRWYPAAGKFQRFFDDVLINATQNLPVSYIDALAPWPLQDCLPFTQQVLAGYFARTYDVELDPGFESARRRIDDAIRGDVRSRIGGDKQRIHDINTRYDAITFKHVLLPVWMLAYRYKDKSYRVFINAGTGEVQGERPYSWVKIVCTVLGGLALILTFLLFMQN